MRELESILQGRSDERQKDCHETQKAIDGRSSLGDRYCPLSC